MNTILYTISPTLLQAHLQFAQANAQAKNCKRAYNANADRNKFGKH